MQLTDTKVGERKAETLEKPSKQIYSHKFTHRLSKEEQIWFLIDAFSLWGKQKIPTTGELFQMYSEIVLILINSMDCSFAL